MDMLKIQNGRRQSLRRIVPITIPSQYFPISCIPYFLAGAPPPSECTVMDYTQLPVKFREAFSLNPFFVVFFLYKESNKGIRNDTKPASTGKSN